MNLLFTLNKNYLPFFISCLRSLEDNNKEKHQVYIFSKDITLDDLKKYNFQFTHEFNIIDIPDDVFCDAPVSNRYPKTIYYRIFASLILPKQVNRILYLDPDIIVKGDLTELYNMDFEDNYYIATTNVRYFLRRINQIKNGAKKDTVYINTGVLLMNLPLLRKKQTYEEVYNYINQKANFFVLPDQDIISTLYGDKIKLVSNLIYNMSDRAIIYHRFYKGEIINLEWVEKNTKIIHYYGKNKPWKENYKGILKPYYDKYALDKGKNGKIAIVLGNRINDDGTITSVMKKRLELAIDLYKEFYPDKIIVSGGVANKNVNVSEAYMMKEYLVEKGLPEECIIMEGKSLTTKENAEFSVPIAKMYNPKEIIICTSFDHFLYNSFNVIKLFGDEINDENIKLVIYTNAKGC